jgi:transcription elongation GreA/GreB family factor
VSLDKHAIVAALRQQISAEIEAMTRIAREAADAVTHEENKAEGDKDMRSTEASYLARGQAGRVQDLERAHAVLGSMELKRFASGAAIESSAVIELRQGKKTTTYFLASAAGGRRVTLDGMEVVTTTTTSPLGKALLGAAEGDEVEIESPQGTRTYLIGRVR